VPGAGYYHPATNSSHRAAARRTRIPAPTKPLRSRLAGRGRIGEANDGGLLGGGGDVWAVASAALGHQLPAAAYSRAGTRQGRSGMLAASALRGW